MSNTPEPVAAPLLTALCARVPAQTVITEFLRLQGTRKRPSILERALGVDGLDPESATLYRYALGVLAVGESLARLGPRWSVLHAVPQGRHADIDHLLIGPPGIFSLGIRDLSGHRVTVAEGALRVGGSSHPFLRDAEYEVGRVERALGLLHGAPVHATGVVVIIDPKGITVVEKPRDVSVVGSADLVPFLQALPDVLTGGDIERLGALAARPDTWLTHAVLPQDGATLRSRFDSVHGGIRTALAIRRLWIVAMSTALLGVVALAAWGIVLAATAG